MNKDYIVNNNTLLKITNKDIVEFNIPDNITIIGDGAFMECENIKKLVIPNGVTKIDEFAFNSCSSLQSINIPYNVKEIGMYAFDGCTNLESITIPKTVKKIGENAFDYCIKLKIYCEANKKPIGWNDNWNPNNLPVVWGAKQEHFHNQNKLRFKVKNGSASVIGYTEEDGSYDIPETITVNSETFNVTSIASSAFRFNSEMFEIVIPNSIKTIGSRAFEYCENLYSINLDSSIKKIGANAFNGCMNLGIIYLKQSIEEIGSLAFNDCDSLVIICESKIKPKKWAEDICIENKQVYWGIAESNIINTEKICYIIRESEAIVAKYIGFGDIDLNIPSTIELSGKSYTVTSIGSGAFEYYWSSENYYTELTNITLGDTISSIGNCAFCNCPELATIYFPKELNYIGDHAFHSCSSLKGSEFPKNLKTIGKWAFYNCTEFTEIVLPNGFEKLEENSFNHCTNLQTIFIPKTVKTIAEGTFSGCSKLTIYCELESEPKKWNKEWNSSSRPVIWGYKKEIK